MTRKKKKLLKQQAKQDSRVVYESGSNETNKNNLNHKQTKTPPKRQPNNLYKLYDKEIINQEQYASGERLSLDYESSFRNKCASNPLDEVRVQKSNKANNEFYVIQNLNAWDRYSKAIMSIEDIKTREVVKLFCIEGMGLTEIDNRMGKRGVAEVGLGYGLSELARYYKILNRTCNN